MDLSNYKHMDPMLLVGIVNTELRDNCNDIEDLCHVHDLERAILEQHLAKVDYHYHPDLKQFR